MVHTLAICGTCPRDNQVATPLAEDLRAALPASDLAAAFELQTLHCLGACRQPCALVFTAPGKWRLRFCRLGPAQLAAVLATAELYCRSSDGLIEPAALPPAMATRFSAASPESLLLSRGAPPPPLAVATPCDP